MRIASDPKHPDYNAAMLPAYVYLNGEYLTDCVFADEEGGEAIVAAKNEHGNIYVVGEEIAVEVRHGHIRIEKKAVPDGAGFDAWMCRRTEAAHAAYMARHSAGGQTYE